MGGRSCGRWKNVPGMLDLAWNLGYGSVWSERNYAVIRPVLKSNFSTLLRDRVSLINKRGHDRHKLCECFVRFCTPLVLLKGASQFFGLEDAFIATVLASSTGSHSIVVAFDFGATTA